MNDDEPVALEAAAGRARETALALMRMALALLDQAGEMTAAARLQHAIDTVGADERCVFPDPTRPRPG